MTDVAARDRCLNCGHALGGPFCSSCGQRAVPPNPTVTELTGDAWQELSGYDGRILATVRGLLRPGQLTLEYLAGRRAYYLPPLRVYLAVSVLYFVIAAAAPDIGQQRGATMSAGGLQIGVTGSRSTAVLTAEDREALRAQLDEAPALLRPLLQSILEDPAAFRARLFTTMPRVLFGMLPIFAAIVALFYRGRHFPASLVFAAHVHAFAFVVLGASELVKFTNWVPAALTAAVLALAVLTVYVLLAFRRVYGGSWPAIAAKTAAIGLIYMFASIPAFMIMLAWAAM